MVADGRARVHRRARSSELRAQAHEMAQRLGEAQKLLGEAQQQEQEARRAALTADEAVGMLRAQLSAFDGVTPSKAAKASALEGQLHTAMEAAEERYPTVTTPDGP